MEYRDAVEESEQDTIDAVEDVARDVGHWLIRQGLGDLWPDLFRQLASSRTGHSVGPDDPDAGPLPVGAALRFLAD